VNDEDAAGAAQDEPEQAGCLLQDAWCEDAGTDGAAVFCHHGDAGEAAVAALPIVSSQQPQPGGFSQLQVLDVSYNLIPAAQLLGPGSLLAGLPQVSPAGQAVPVELLYAICSAGGQPRSVQVVSPAQCRLTQCFCLLQANCGTIMQCNSYMHARMDVEPCCNHVSLLHGALWP